MYWLKSVLLYSLYLLVLLLLSSFFIFQIPAVQTRISKGLLSKFSEQTGFKSTLGRMEFYWFDRVMIDQLSITDPEGNTMISVNKLLVNFSFDGIFGGANIKLDGVSLDSASVFLTPIRETDSTRNLNINVFSHRLVTPGRKSTQGGGSISIGEAIVQRSLFTYDNDRDSLAAGFDYNHFTVQLREAEIQKFFLLGDTVQFHVTSFQATEQKNHFTIHQLQTFFRISDTSIEFQGLQLHAGESLISDTVVFTFDKPDALSDFVNRVSLQCHLVNTTLHPSDLSVFFPEAAEIPKPIQVSGHLTGPISDFRFSNMTVQTGNTRLNGTLQMEGLPNLTETFIVLNLNETLLDFSDISFLLDEPVARRLFPLGVVKMTGQFLGYPTDFVANGDFVSALGKISSDINLKLNETNFERSSYRGKIALIDFALGRYLNDTLNFQNVSMAGQINGSGLTISSADFTLDGKVTALGIKGYTYTGIETNARFASQLFAGELSVKDPNLKLRVNGSIDLRKGVNRIKILTTLDTLNAHKLNLANEQLFIKTKMDIDLQGLELDSLRGSASLKSFMVIYKDESLTLNNILLRAERSPEQRKLKLETTLADAEVSGNFYFSDVFSDIQKLIKEFYLTIENNTEAIKKYYSVKLTRPQPYRADFAVHLKNIGPAIEIADLPLAISMNTRIEGSFTQGETARLQAFTRFDSLVYGGQSYYQNQIELSASKVFGSTQTLAMVYLNSQHQILAKNLNTKNLIAEAIWDGSHIAIDFGIRQEPGNILQVAATIDFKDSTYIRFLPSTIQLLEQKWRFNPLNEIAIKGKEWNFKQVELLHEQECIGLNGYLSADSTRELTLRIRDFQLNTLNPIIQRKISGKTNAFVTLSNYFGQFTIQNSIILEKLTVDDFLIGTITGDNLWDPDTRRFNLKFIIDRLDARIVNCTGYYNPSDGVSPLNLTANFTQANLKIFEPFLDDLFSKFQGTLTGAYTVTGQLADPKLNGFGRIEHGGLVVNYLKTAYQFTGTIGLTPTSIYFKDINLTDAFRNRALLSGTIKHKNFGNMEIDLSARFTDFQVLNTTAQDNSLFYGQGYASGDVTITGPVNNLKISANASTRKNTRIFIPISGTSLAEQKDFISFVNFNDSTYQSEKRKEKEADKRINLTGVTIDFNIDVTPDAYCEIIFDLKAGDIIRGRGNGKIKLQLDTKGEFNMFGPMEFTEGWYNFTLYDIINKEFQIKPGSRITWFGDPYQAVLNIDASYNQLASLAPILSDPTLSEVTQIKRKYPVQVLLKLEGPMLSPQINFDIAAKDLPKSIPVDGRPPVALDLEFYSFKNKIDEQELKKQVFSLIILRRFSPLESGISMSGSVANSVSELLSNQLSYWMSQVDENLVIDVDLGTMDQETFNTFQLRLSYTFLNGRLRVTGDGTFNNQTSATNTGAQPGSTSPIAGDWTVDYLLTPDGKFKVKMYSRTNVNQLATNVSNQTTFTTGISLMHTQSFNELKDLLKSSRDKNLRKPEDTEPETESRKENEGN